MKDSKKKVEAPKKPKKYNMLKDGSLEFISTTSKNPSSVPSWRKK